MPISCSSCTFRSHNSGSVQSDAVGLVYLFLICVVAYVIKRMRNRQSILPFKKPEPKLPPHEQAIKELDEIKQQKLWQQGRSKEYYTLITDTLRRYIVDRFGNDFR